MALKACTVIIHDLNKTMTADLRERERNLFGQSVGFLAKQTHDAPEMNGGGEVLQIKIENQFAPHMSKRIGLDAALWTKPWTGDLPL